MTTSEAALTTSATSELPTLQQWQLIREIAGTLVASKMLPDAIKTPEAASAIILKGLELGIPAMQSFSHIHVIQGKPTCSAELMLARMARGGGTAEWQTSPSTEARVSFRRPGWGDVVGEFSMDDAQAAGLTKNPTWKSYPSNMLRARAISNGARMIGPDLLAGMSYTPEELGATVTADGDPVLVATEVAVAPDTPAPALPPSGNGGIKKRFAAKGDSYRGKDAYHLDDDLIQAVIEEYGAPNIEAIDEEDTDRMTAIVRALDGYVSDRAAVEKGVI